MHRWHNGMPDKGASCNSATRRMHPSIRNALERHRRDAARMQRDMEAHQGPYGTFEGSALQETLSKACPNQTT